MLHPYQLGPSPCRPLPYLLGLLQQLHALPQDLTVKLPALPQDLPAQLLHGGCRSSRWPSLSASLALRPGSCCSASYSVASSSWIF